MKWGLKNERKNNKVECEINQLVENQREARIEYYQKRYENSETALFFYRFRFYNREDRQTDWQLSEPSDQKFKYAVFKYNYKFVNKNNEY